MLGQVSKTGIYKDIAEYQKVSMLGTWLKMLAMEVTMKKTMEALCS